MKALLAIGVLAMTAGSAAADIAGMPAQTGVFSGATRGYWFTAPVAFRITGVRALQQTGSTNAFMNWAVVRFDGNTPPPVFSTVTNAFQQLGLGLDQSSAGFAPTLIDVNAGDVIGIYGNTTAAVGGTAGAASYAGTAPTTTIFGNVVSLARSGMQFHLGSTTSPAGMHDLWSEPTSANITRVEFEYTQIPAPASLGLLAFGGMAASRRRR